VIHDGEQPFLAFTNLLLGFDQIGVIDDDQNNALGISRRIGCRSDEHLEGALAGDDLEAVLALNDPLILYDSESFGDRTGLL
jgi:hypothetical protein